MDTENGIINNNFSGLEVHAINPVDFEQHPINLQQDIEKHYNFTTVPIALQVLEPEQKSVSSSKVVYDKPEYVRNVDKHIEVLKSAKSLFSKRTLTLYHWMYPTIPKQQLKVNVAAAWENLPLTEKHFYISQVLGKFGYPQTSLMLNPQLQSLTSTSPALLTNAIQTTTTSTTSTMVQQQRKRAAETEMALRKTGASKKGLDQRNLILAGSQLLNAGDSTRSVLIPKQQRLQQANNPTQDPPYEQAEFVEVIKSTVNEEPLGQMAVYEIRLENGGGTCVVNQRIPDIGTSGSNAIGNNAEGIAYQDSLNRFMANMLRPQSMGRFVQNGHFPARMSTRNRPISKRRGRPPALKKRPVKKNSEKQYVTIEIEDDFPDDPELRQELEQFQSTLNMEI